MWPGVISAICFALFFLGHYLAGLAGWEVVALFILGLVLVLIEILFFAHSTIVFGVLGVFLMIASLLWTMIDRYPQQPFLPTGKMLAIPLLNMFIAIVGSCIVIALLARYLPRTSFYRRFALTDSNPPGPSLAGAPRQFATATRACARNARHSHHGIAAQRQSALRRSLGRCRNRRRIHRTASTGHHYRN